MEHREKEFMNNRLRDIRRARGMSQGTLATLTGMMFQGEVSLVESGKRPPSDVERAALSAVLGVSAYEIFPEDDGGIERRAYR
jgi:transcriptional regulator with XRE-family HTH domain